MTVNGCHFKIDKIRHISATFGPIATKFVRITHIAPQKRNGTSNFEFLKSKMADGRH